MKLIFYLAIQLAIALSVSAQINVITPDLSEVLNSTKWSVIDREVSYSNAVISDGKPGNGLLILKDFTFANGTIELDIKGKDAQGMSFVGFAFHGLNDSTYDAVYFRPFNFKNSERKTHSLQYISMPQNDWYKLRSEHPDKYENMITPVPDPNNWFHATITINYPEVKVFVENANKPSLVIQQLSTNKKGWIGFWLGNNSEGAFKNLKITGNSK